MVEELVSARYFVLTDKQDRSSFQLKSSASYMVPMAHDFSPGGGVLPSKRLMGMCRWTRSHFRNWTDYNIGLHF